MVKLSEAEKVWSSVNPFINYLCGFYLAAAFGGNPSQLTLMGQGYGSVMVNLLLVSPVTKGKINVWTIMFDLLK